MESHPNPSSGQISNSGAMSEGMHPSAATNDFQGSGSDDDEPPPILESSSSSDDDMMTDLAASHDLHERDLGEDLRPAFGHNQNQTDGGHGSQWIHANDSHSQPHVMQGNAQRTTANSQAFPGQEAQFQPAGQFMGQHSFVFNLPSNNGVSGVAIGPLGSLPGAFDLISSALGINADGGANGGMDPFLQVLQASFNVDQREKPKASAAAWNTVLSLKVAADEVIECPISAEPLEEGSWAARMPCGHYFSHEGLAQWLSHNNTCPVCRYEVPTIDDQYNMERRLSIEQAGRAAKASSQVESDFIGRRMARVKEDALTGMLVSSLNELPLGHLIDSLEEPDFSNTDSSDEVLLEGALVDILQLWQAQFARRYHSEAECVDLSSMVDQCVFPCIPA